MKIWFFWPFSLVLVFQTTEAQLYKPKSEKERLIMAMADSEMQSLFNLTSIRCKYSFADIERNLSTPQDGIVLGVPYLNKIAVPDGRNNVLFSVRFILAHEIAHQLQFRAYPGDISTAVCEKRRLYECQADILAGIITGNRYNVMNGGLRDNLPNDIIDGIEFVYGLGDVESGQQFHPNPIQRRNALRYGLGYSLNYAPGIKVLSSGNDINLQPGEDSIKWSMRIAKEIMHYPLKLTQMIVCTDEGITWDTSTVNPVVKFSNEYLNKYEKPLRLNIAYEVCGVRAFNHRMIPDMVPRHTPVKGNISFFSLVIPPGERVVCSGELSWRTVSTKEYMPRMILNTDDDALYNVEAITPLQDVPETDNCMDDFIDLSKTKTTGNERDIFFIDLERIRSNLILDEWQNLEKGFGNAISTRTFTSYQSKIKFPYSISDRIYMDIDPKNSWFPNGFMSITFYEGKDSMSGLSMYNKIASMIMEHYKGSGVKWEASTVNEDDLYEKSFEGELPGSKLVLLVSFRIRDDYCFTTMTLRKPVIHRRKPKP